jgi:hypothetical protein
MSSSFNSHSLYESHVQQARDAASSVKGFVFASEEMDAWIDTWNYHCCFLSVSITNKGEEEKGRQTQ